MLPWEISRDGEELPPEWLNVDLAPLYRQLEHTDAASAAPLIEAYLRPLAKMTGSSLLMGRYVMMDIRLGAARLLTHSGINPAEAMPELLHWADEPRDWAGPQHMVDEAVGLLCRCLNCRDRRAAAVPANAAVRAACAYMEAGFQQKELTLHEAARYVGLSNNHFCMLFRREMGVSFVEHLTHLRMEQAKRYLRETDLSSADIGERVGYTDPCYFRTLFKRHTGMSPREYRLTNR